MKILVVGYGSIGKRHVTNLLDNSKAEIIICTKRKDLKFLGKNVIVVNSIDKALKENPTIGFITNETSYHIPTAIKLAKAGLDLFIEKPLSNSTATARSNLRFGNPLTLRPKSFQSHAPSDTPALCPTHFATEPMWYLKAK